MLMSVLLIFDSVVYQYSEMGPVVRVGPLELT